MLEQQEKIAILIHIYLAKHPSTLTNIYTGVIKPTRAY